MPEKGSCNDADALLKDLSTQANGKYCDVYLVGIGIAKLLLLSRWRDQSGALVIDIGCGIDALAGIVHRERFYFGRWLNYRLKSWDYDKIDLLAVRKSRKQPLVKWIP